MKLSFHGAARSVTGSMHLLHLGRSRLLLECGLFQGHREEANRINRNLPFPARSVDAAILSHAHIDHSGNLPTLVRSGFRGRIFVTEATAELAELMLRDSAHIQESDAEYLNRKYPDKPRIVPLYTAADVEKTVRKFRAVAYREWFEPARDARARFLDAGHIIGSGIVEIECREESRLRRVVFTGDLGRGGAPILRDPEPLPACDALICESTYGDRPRERGAHIEEDLAKVLRGCAAERGRILIPAFSVGRTQSLLYVFSRIMMDGRAPTIPIFVDSPLSTKTTRLLMRYPDLFDQEAQELFRDPDAHDFFRKYVRLVESVEESKALNKKPNPIIIVSASGMCESGRILHHLRHAIENPCNVVLLVGFQAANTLGRRLQEGQKRVRILGEEHEVRARVVDFQGFSAHADRNELIAALAPLAKRPPVVFLVHGEEESARSLAEALRAKGFPRIEIPERGSVFEL